jgi:tetratricopeptide (TPR) repeat protein
MARISRKELKRDELLEATKEAEHWLVEHWRTIAQVAAVIVAIGLIVGGWFWYSDSRRARAEQLLQQGTARFRDAQAAGFSDRSALEEALTRFEEAARKGGQASAGLVARYYQGVTLYRLDRTEEAVAPLSAVAESQSAPGTLTGSATAMLAEVHERRGQISEAIELLKGLTEADPPTYPVDQALLELGDLYDRTGETERARACWQRIVDEFPVRGSAETARRRLGS